MSALLGLLAGALQVVAGVPYVRDVLNGSTRPHRATWLIWCVLSIIVFLSQRADGARWSLVLVGVQVLGTCLVFVLSLRHGVGGRSPLELALLGLAGLGVLGWQLAGVPVIATGCVVFADLIAVAIMLPKTYRDPTSETLSAYLIGLLSVVFSIAAIGALRIDLVLYPVYLLAADSAVVALIVSGRRRLRRAANPAV